MAYNYGPCDTFFVADDAEMERRRQASSRREILANRHRLIQDVLAQNMSEREMRHYGDDIILYLHELEVKAMPDVYSIDLQSEIRWHMRPYLLDFLVEVHQSMGLLPETLFLAVNILDRYCSRRVVFKKHYQLVGCTALLIASKYGEASKRVPHIRELQSMCCDQYDEEMFIQMERHVLTNLDWLIGCPTVDEFLSLALEGTDPDSEVKNMALYISQTALMHRDFVSIRPSELAKCSLDLARIVTGKREQARDQAPWTFHYDQTVLHALSSILHTPSKVLRNIFRHHSFDCVSVVLDDFLLKVQQQQQQHIEQMAAPGTPPRQEATMAEEMAKDAGFYHTPQKHAFGPTMLITPPLTPEGDQFHATQQKAYAAQVGHLSMQMSAPPTPTSDASSYQHSAVYLQPMPTGMPSAYYEQAMTM